MNCKTTSPSVSLNSVCSVYSSRVQAELQPVVSLTCCRCVSVQLPKSVHGADVVGWFWLILQAQPGYFRGN